MNTMQSGAAPNLMPLPATPRRDYLQALAERALNALAADGSAIALTRDDEIVCEASVGAAPAVDSRLDSSSTLSAQCLRTQVPIVHSERPGRNGASADSFLLVPVMREGRAIGLCVAYAARENAFTSDHIAWLIKTAESVASPPIAAKQVDAARPVESKIPEVEGSKPEPLTPNIATLPPSLDAETLRGLEEDIAQFEREEKRRAKVVLALKGAGVAVLLCVFALSFIPDRVAAWVRPIVTRVEHQFTDRQSPPTQRVTPQQSRR